MSKPKKEKTGTRTGKSKPRAKTKGTGTGTRRTTRARSKAPKRTRASRSTKKATTRRSKPAAAVDTSSELGVGPGPRMAQILQAEIAPWKRDNLSDEEAQLKEINRMPVRNVYDSEEARRRLVGRTTSPGKRRLRSRSTSTSNA